MNYYQCPQGVRNTYPQPPQMTMPTPECKPLAIASVPTQKFEDLFPDEVALSQGTLFKKLKLPFYGRR